MSIYEYDEEKQRKFDREEGREEGLVEGEKKGKRELIAELLKNGEITPECAKKYESMTT